MCLFHRNMTKCSYFISRGQVLCPLKKTNHSYTCVCKLCTGNRIIIDEPFDINLSTGSGSYYLMEFVPYENSKNDLIIIQTNGSCDI